jgi:hypothetical protein
MAFEDLHLPVTRTPRMGRRRVMYVPNNRSFGAFMRSEQMRDVTADVAADIVSLARVNVKDQPGAEEHTGLHDKVREGFKVQREAGLMKVGGNLRVKVTITGVDGSALLEFGARGLSRQRMLGRAGAHFGDFKPEGGPT